MRREQTISASPLPSGYKQLDYIQGTGTQYIDFTVNAQKNVFFGIEGDFIPYYAQNVSGYAIFRSNVGYQFVAEFYSYNANTGYVTYTSGIGGAFSSGGWGGINGEKTHYQLSTTHKNGTPLSRPITQNFSYLRFFKNTSGSTYQSKFCSVKITVGSDVIYDCVAALRIVDSKPGFYDFVSVL